MFIAECTDLNNAVTFDGIVTFMEPYGQLEGEYFGETPVSLQAPPLFAPIAYLYPLMLNAVLFGFARRLFTSHTHLAYLERRLQEESAENPIRHDRGFAPQLFGYPHAHNRSPVYQYFR